MFNFAFKMYVKTRLTPKIKVYDSLDNSPSAMGDTVKSLLQPEVWITDANDNTLYKYGATDTENIFPYLVLGVVAIIIYKVIK